MPHLEPAVQVDDDASDYPAKGNELKTRILVGVAHDTEMHDSATTQTIPHPSQDLALESPQLPLPPHDIGTRSPPTLSSSSSSSSSSLPSVPSALPYSPPLQSLHNAVSEPANKQQEQACVTVAVHDLPNVNCAVGLSVDANGNGRSSAFAVQPRATSLLPRGTSPPSTPLSTNPAVTPESKLPSPSSIPQSYSHSTSNIISSEQQIPQSSISNPPATSREGKMPFGLGGRRKSSSAENDGSRKPLSEGQVARNLANTNAVTNYEAGLQSKDRAVQREAIKRYLAERIKSDWTWPPLTPTSTYPNTSETGQSPITAIVKDLKRQHEEKQPTESLKDAIDTPHVRSWQERADWSYSDDTDGIAEPEAQPVYYADEKTTDPVDATGLDITIKKGRRERRQDRMIKTKAEMSWNAGLRCFTERRDAWTGARIVKHPMDVAGSRAEEVEETRHSSSSKDGGSSTAGEDSEWEDCEIPIVDPILPEDNPIRAQITHAAYNTIYDKVVTQAMTPSIPINLKDVVGSCVQGWKRDGQWENKASSAPGNLRKRTGTFSSMLGLKSDPPLHPSIIDAKKDQGTQTGAFRRGYEKLFKKGRTASGSTI